LISTIVSSAAIKMAGTGSEAQMFASPVMRPPV
jgi:hypothetical protein